MVHGEQGEIIKLQDYTGWSTVNRLDQGDPGPDQVFNQGPWNSTTYIQCRWPINLRMQLRLYYYGMNSINLITVKL